MSDRVRTAEEQMRHIDSIKPALGIGESMTSKWTLEGHSSKSDLFWILEGHTPKLADLLTWAKWFETAERHVGLDKVGEVKISTVFLGLDHGFGDGDPVLFETMVFGGKLDQDQERYCTWEEAEAGHKAMIEKVKSAQEAA